jgi:hypothetical protein
MDKPKIPSEVDSIEIVRDALILARNKALTSSNFSDAVLFSHAIAWLYYAAQAEKYLKEM